MNDEQKELLLESVLAALRDNQTLFGMSPRQVHAFTRLDLPVVTEVQVLERIEYAIDRGLAEEVQKAAMKQNRAFRITHAGRAYLDDRNL